MIVESDRQRRAADFIEAAEKRGEDVTDIMQAYLEEFCPTEAEDEEIEASKASAANRTLKTWDVKKIDKMIDYLNHDKPLELK